MAGTNQFKTFRINQFKYTSEPNYTRIKAHAKPLHKRNKFKDAEFRKEYDKRRWSRRNSKLLYGCVPLDQLHFSQCRVCGTETVNYRTTKRDTCGRECGRKLASIVRKENNLKVSQQCRAFVTAVSQQGE